MEIITIIYPVIRLAEEQKNKSNGTQKAVRLTVRPIVRTTGKKKPQSRGKLLTSVIIIIFCLKHAAGSKL